MVASVLFACHLCQSELIWKVGVNTTFQHSGTDWNVIPLKVRKLVHSHNFVDKKHYKIKLVDSVLLLRIPSQPIDVNIRYIIYQEENDN